MRRRRVDIPLTPELRDLAAEAYRHAGKVVGAYVRRFGSAADFPGYVGLQIVRHIRDYDPALSLRAWSLVHASWACRDVLRYESRFRRRHLSIARDVEPAATDPRPVREQVEHLLRGLGGDERRILWGIDVEHRTRTDLAGELGYLPDHVSQLRRETLDFLRRRELAGVEGRGGR